MKNAELLFIKNKKVVHKCKLMPLSTHYERIALAPKNTEWDYYAIDILDEDGKYLHDMPGNVLMGQSANGKSVLNIKSESFEIKSEYPIIDSVSGVNPH